MQDFIRMLWTRKFNTIQPPGTPGGFPSDSGNSTPRHPRGLSQWLRHSTCWDWRTDYHGSDFLQEVIKYSTQPTCKSKSRAATKTLKSIGWHWWGQSNATVVEGLWISTRQCASGQLTVDCDAPVRKVCIPITMYVSYMTVSLPVSLLTSGSASGQCASGQLTVDCDAPVRKVCIPITMYVSYMTVSLPVSLLTSGSASY